LLNLELWNDFFTKKGKKHEKIELRQAPIMMALLFRSRLSSHFTAPARYFTYLVGQLVRFAVGHLWVVNAHCVSPDHYASGENKKFNKVQPEYLFVRSK
jgi:hypothetical protein